MRIVSWMFSYFENLVDPFSTSSVSWPPVDFLGFLKFHSKPLMIWILMVGAVTTLVAVAELLLFNYIGLLINWLGSTAPVEFFARYRSHLVFAGILTLVIWPLLILFQSLIIRQTLHGNLASYVRWVAHCYTLRQDIDYFYAQNTGKLSQKIMHTATTIRDMSIQVAQVFVHVFIYLLGMIVIAVVADARLLLPICAWVVSYFFIVWKFVPEMQSTSRKQAGALSSLFGYVTDVYSNISIIKMFSRSRTELHHTRETMSEHANVAYQHARVASMLYVLLQLINSILLVSVSSVAILAWKSLSMSVGEVAVVITLAMRLRAMSQSVLWEISGFLNNVGVIQDAIATLSRAPSVTDPVGASELRVTEGRISARNICFSYGCGKEAIRNLSLDIRPGERVGIVGRSGAGKSTLVNLLIRFYDLCGGMISIDGQDISSVTQESLRKSISIVTQDIALLNRSVRENISYGSLYSCEERIREVACLARANSFIEKLKDAEGRSGYEAYVGERGVTLSGGQRQRIAIARAIFKDAPILILDEATSALDSEVEQAIHDNLYQLIQGKTVIAIAHRLSTIAMLDRLIVIEDGAIVEEGRHDELLELGGIYATLWKHQSGGFLSK